MNDMANLSVSEESLIADALSGLRDSAGISGTMLRANVGGIDAAVELEVAGRKL